MSTGTVQENLAALHARIEASVAAARRAPGSVRLVAVSKTQPAARLEAAYHAGQRVFGENRVQELLLHAGALPADCEWHLIGHLQSNKVRPAVRVANWIHSVDSLDILVRLERICGEEARCPCILLQINISEETSKSGLPPAQADAVLDAALSCRNLACKGLMTLAPFGAAPAELHRIFGGLRKLRDRLATRFGAALPELSMGMSADFAVAIQEGATLVRVGSAVFGPRSA